MNKVDVKVKRLHPDAVIPKYSHLFDSGFDLVAVKDEIVYPGKSVKFLSDWPFNCPRGLNCRSGPDPVSVTKQNYGSAMPQAR